MHPQLVRTEATAEPIAPAKTMPMHGPEEVEVDSEGINIGMEESVNIHFQTQTPSRRTIRLLS